MTTDNEYLIILALVLGGMMVVALLIHVVSWSRHGGKGAIMFAAAFFAFIPDPLLERQIQAVQKAREDHAEQDQNGDPPANDPPALEERA